MGKRFLILICFLLGLASPSFAQFTTVTATVQDPNGIPYSGAVMNAILVPSTGGGYTLGGQPYSGRVGPVTLDSTGKFTAQFGDVTLITPGSPQWQITIDSAAATIQPPLGTGPQSFTYTSSGTTISGSSPVSLTTALNALAPKLTNFATSGTVTNVSGTSPIVSSGGTTPAISCPTCNTTVPLAPNGPGIPQPNGTTYDPTNFGAKWDALSVVGCSGTGGLFVVTCSNANFNILTDVGKVFWGSGTPNATPDVPATTISTVNSSTQVTLTGALARTMVAGQIVYGHDDTTQINNMWAALLTNVNCGHAHFPSGGTIFSSQIMTTVSPTCTFNQNNLGYTLAGEGQMSTQFFVPPNFTYFSPSKCSNTSIGACFGPGAAIYKDFQISAGFDPNGEIYANTYNGCWFPLGSTGAMQNINIAGFIVPGTMRTVCVSTGIATISNTFIQASGNGGSPCSALGIAGGDITVDVLYVNSVCTNDGGAITASGPDNNFYNVFDSEAVQNPILITGGSSDFFSLALGDGIKATGAGTQVHISNSDVVENVASLTNMITAAAGATVTLSGSRFSNVAAGTNYVVGVDATSTFIDGCGNTFSSNTATANVSAGGIFVPCPGTIYKGSPSTPTLTGTGACATFSTQNGTLYYGSFACSGTTGAATITITPGTTASHGFRCAASDTTTPANTIPTGPLATGGCAFSAANIANGDIISFEMIPF
jgi:hypothetical protein